MSLVGKLFRNRALRKAIRTVWGLSFPGTLRYWESRYASGRDSGDGSYGRLASFKAEVVNRFVEERGIGSVVELGCGDGAQLSLARYPEYVGVDVSRTAVRLCRERFADDPAKRFLWYDPEDRENGHLPGAELALSLDVIYHLVEDRIYERYMRDLFGAAQRYVIIYSCDDDEPSQVPYVRHRCFTPWVRRHLPEWRLLEHVPNPYPFDPDNSVREWHATSVADFYIYERAG